MRKAARAESTRPVVGKRDGQTVVPGGARAIPPRIAGVEIIELGNILTRSGWMTEVFRTDWAKIGIAPRQISWAQLNPNGVTDWHHHTRQTDHLVGVGGNLKLALWDGRKGSPTYNEAEVLRMGAMRPVLVIVPPGVWHALRNESGESAGYINVTDQLYSHENPDNWRLTPDVADVPDIL